jgi:hypothetical protein
MPDSANPVKAMIVNLDSKEEIPCLFNPTEYEIAKSNNWGGTTQSTGTEARANTALGKNMPQVEFQGGGAMTLSLNLFFDTTITGADVRALTDPIWKLMRVDTNVKDAKSTLGRPPMVAFQWGAVQLFKAVISQINQKFTLFSSEGKPLRSTMALSFMQSEDEGFFYKQNPTTAVKPGYKQRVIKDGDTIDWIAHEEYGDAAMWRFIAEANNLDNVHKLRPGQLLSIAPLP